MNFPIDIGFGDIDKPLDNSKSGSRFLFDTEDNIKDFCLSIQSILSAIDHEYDIDYITKETKKLLDSGKYHFEVPTYRPKRKFQAYPICKKCKRIMKLIETDKHTVQYVCECGSVNVSNEAQIK